MTPSAPAVLEKAVTSDATSERASDGASGRAPDGATTSTAGVLRPDQLGQAFTLERRIPSAAVADRVERHWITRWDLRGRDDHVQEVLPHPCVNLVAYSGIVRVHGIPVARDARRLSGQGAAIGTKFRPGAFAAFSRIPMPELRDQAATLEQALGPDGRALEAEILAAAPDVDAVIAAVERFLAPRIPDHDPGFTLALAVARDMLRRGPEVRVAAIARDHGIAERTLQRIFREQIGVGPKWVLRRYRMHEATERLAAEGAQDLSGLAADLGYVDQAHLTNDFRATIGCTPAAYARACGH